MRKNSNSKFENFADFLFQIDAEGPSAESVLRLEKCISEQLERAKTASKKSWLGRAQAERKKFEESTKDLISNLAMKYGSRPDLISAIQNGLLGTGAKDRLLLQFRNRKADQLSDDDLRAIVGDQEILELLRKFKGDK
jgi:hypothetical protein